MTWISQQPDWPDFRYDPGALQDRELEFRINSARLAGCFEALPIASREEATINVMLSEAIKTSAIEGENLDRESVRSSLLALIVSDTLPDGAASLLAALTDPVRSGLISCSPSRDLLRIEPSAELKSKPSGSAPTSGNRSPLRWACWCRWYRVAGEMPSSAATSLTVRL